MQALADPQRRSSVEIPRTQRHRAVTLSQCLANGAPREQAMLRAHAERHDDDDSDRARIRSLSVSGQPADRSCRKRESTARLRTLIAAASSAHRIRAHPCLRSRRQLSTSTTGCNSNALAGYASVECHEESVAAAYPTLRMAMPAVCRLPIGHTPFETPVRVLCSRCACGPRIRYTCAVRAVLEAAKNSSPVQGRTVSRGQWVVLPSVPVTVS